MTEMDDDTKKAVVLIETLLTLAEANWPRDSDVKLETSGHDPHGTIRVSAYTIRKTRPVKSDRSSVAAMVASFSGEVRDTQNV